MATVKKNLFYSVLLTTSSYVMSLVVFPYVSRVLGPSSLGLTGFAEGTVGCFVLIATMGINYLGIREISRARGDQASLSATYSSLIALSLVATAIGVAGFVVAGVLIPDLRQHPALFACGVVSIVAQVFLIEWFYKGLENFKYITVRNIAVKLCYVSGVFLLVKDPSNYLIYFALIVATYAANSLINLMYARRFARLSLRRVEIRKYVKPFLSLGSYTLVASLYITFNPMFLGIVADNAQVGYYSVSVKVFIIILNTFTALTTVLMPRMSVLLSQGEEDRFREGALLTMRVFTALAIPLALLGIYYSPQIVSLISGDAYGAAVLPMQILMPLLFVNGYAQILIVQVLMPLNGDRIILRNSRIVGLLILALNIALVPLLGAVGSAIVWTVCELTMLALSQRAASRLTGLTFFWRPMLSTLLYSLPGVALLFAVSFLPINQYLQALLGGTVFIAAYAAIQLHVVKDEACLFVLNSMRRHHQP